MDTQMTISRLASAVGVHVETVRYYQRRGLLLEPERPAGGVRRYGREDVVGLLREVLELLVLFVDNPGERLFARVVVGAQAGWNVIAFVGGSQLVGERGNRVLVLVGPAC